MNLAEIENAIENLTTDDLQELVRKCVALIETKRHLTAEDYCDEDNADLLQSLDDGIRSADRGGRGYSANEIRTQMRQWPSMKKQLRQ